MIKLSEAAKKLTLKQRKFCEAYTRSGSDYGNATKAYAEANGKNLETHENHCAVAGANSIRKYKILEYVHEIIQQSTLSEANTDLQLSKIMDQDKDLPSKMRAIEHNNKLKARIVERTENINKNYSVGFDESDPG